MGKGGDSSTANAEPLPAPGSPGRASLTGEAAFAPFLDASFNATEFASAALARTHLSAAAQTHQMQESIRRLNSILRGEVSSKQHELLAQVGHLREAEPALRRITSAADGLQAELRRACSEVQEPYLRLRRDAVKLHNLQGTVELLRHAMQRLKLTQKLKQQMGKAEGSTSLDLAKAAKLLTDVAVVGSEADLSGIDVLEADEGFLRDAGQQVRTQAQAALLQGLGTLSQADVGSALQVYFNLDELNEAVVGTVERASSQFARAVKDALDSKKLSAGAASAGGGLLGGPGAATRADAPAPGTSAKWQEVLWQRLGKIFEQLHLSAVTVWHLQRVLVKKRDPLTHVCFMDAYLATEETPLPSDAAWDVMVKVLESAMAAAAAPARGGFVRESLTAQYPRLALLLESTFQRLVQDTDVKGVPPAVVSEQLNELLATAAPFQHAHQGAALARISDAVQAAFQGGTRPLPTAAELQKCIARLHDELKAAGDSPRLAALTARSVGKALQLMAEKAEYMAATGPEVRSITGPCTSAQLRNIALSSALQEVHRSLATLLPRMPPAAAAVLTAPLDAIRTVAIEAVLPLFKAMVEAAEQHLLRMHGEGLGQEGPGELHTSGYMRDLTHHLSHCRLEYLSKFMPAPSPHVHSFAAALVQRMASRVLIFFVRHASLLRPLSDTGRLQLAKDMADLEAAVGQSLVPLEHIGTPFRMLRAFRPLLFLDTAAILDSPLVQALPPSIVLHHLYSRAPQSLQSPHTRSGFTAAQYSLWLDQHTSEDVLRFIRSALTACQTKAEHEPGFDEVFPVMMKLCKAAS